MGENEENGFVQWRHAPPSAWQFCPLCRTDLVDHAWDGKVRRYCSACGFVYWERPVSAAAVVIGNPGDSGTILLVSRRYPPAVGAWTLPGGGIEMGESVEEAAVREAQEETGLDVQVDTQLGTWSSSTRRTLVTFFVAHPVGGLLQAGTDALEAAWVKLEALPPLAFSTHEDALKRYREMRERGD